MQKVMNIEPVRVQVILKKKRYNECFADATFDAFDSTAPRQESADESRTFIISCPQHFSVFASFLSGKSKKLFISKGKNSKCAASATFQSTAAQYRNSNDSKGISQLSDTIMNSDCSDKKLPSVENFKAETAQLSIGERCCCMNDINNDSNPLMHKSSTTLPSHSISQQNNTRITETKSDQVKNSDSSEIERRDPTLLLLNSHDFGPNYDKCTSVSSIQPLEYINEDLNRRENNSIESSGSLSYKLSRGFLDFTQNSSDRLQKWKTKLQNGRRHKDSSEPPPKNRGMQKGKQKQSEHLSDIEMVLDWSISKCESAKNCDNGFASVGSAFVPRRVRPRLIESTRSVSDLCPTSANYASTTFNKSEKIMEHRTLRQPYDSGTRTVKSIAAHFQNMKSVQTTAQTSERIVDSSDNLPSPVRITPFSGVQPKDTDIVRPVAFRPYVSRKAKTHQIVTSSPSCNTNEKRNNLPSERLLNTDDLKRPSQQVKDAMSSSVLSSSSSQNNCKQRGIYQLPTSSEMKLVMPVCRKSSTVESEENDYDVVPEYMEREKFCTNVDSASSENYSAVHTTPFNYRNPPPLRAPSSAPALSEDTVIVHRNKLQQQHESKATTPIVTVGHSQNSVKKPLSSHVSGSSTSAGSRYSSGIHVTPSPSDSGIVDYETIIRDRENELTNVRATMEQNEEAVVKVYLEKERIWKEQLADLKQKLQASQQGEDALRQQIQRCNEQREQFQATIQNLTDDKQGLHRKCLQVERELIELRERFDGLMKGHGEIICSLCRKHCIFNGIAMNAATTISNDNDTDKCSKRSVSTPKHSKDMSSECELRGEVDMLRNEVFTLRDTLNEQIILFADERKRWEEERHKILNSKSRALDSLGLLLTNDTPSSNITSRLSGNLKIFSDGETYVVSRDRLI